MVSCSWVAGRAVCSARLCLSVGTLLTWEGRTDTSPRFAGGGGASRAEGQKGVSDGGEQLLLGVLAGLRLRER